MATENESRKLNDLRVVDLRTELEKRDLDKTGVKAVLLERLQKALKEEGHDPETYIFELSDVKKTPTRGRKSEEEASEDDKVEEEEDNQPSDTTTVKKENEEEKSDSNEVKKEEPEVEKEEKSESTPKTDEIKGSNAEDDQTTDSESKPCDSKKEEKIDTNEHIKNNIEPKTEIKEEQKETPADKITEETKIKAEEPKNTISGSENNSEKTQASEETSQTKNISVSSVKEEKPAPEANGIIDNEDSINLTIGEDEEKLLADEEDSSQEKDHKDESHGSSGHKKTTAGEKSQDKTNQEKMDGKSSAVGDKAAKDDKNKKIALGGSSRNLWVSGLATTTRATDLKQVFSKYGKVIGAKVVTNARTPGARCYGYVTMSNPDDANKAVQFLHHTELHGRLISVEKAKGDSTGPPKRSEPVKVDSPTKKVEIKKDQVTRKVDVKKEETLVPPGTEGEEKQPEAPGTEGGEAGGEKKDGKESGGHRSRETTRRSSPRTGEKRPRSTTSSHRSGRAGSPVLNFDKIKEERERQRLREKERMLREEERRRETERLRQKEIDRAQREEFERLERERKKLKMERERLLREKDELMRLKLERQRLQQERQKLERERLEKEKEELERLKRQNLSIVSRLEEEVRRKRSLSSSRDREYETKRHRATDTRYVSSSSSRYPDSPRGNDYKKEPPVHKSSRELPPPPRRPGFEPDSSRRLVTSVSSSSRDNWPSKERESRYERTSVNSSNFRDDSISSRTKPSETRLVRERYAENSKSERFVERGSDSWHGGGSSSGGGGSLKTFSSRGETWVSGAGDRKPDHLPEPWSRPTNSTTRWPSSGAPLGLSSRSGPQSGISNPMFASNNLTPMPGMGIGMSNLGPFTGGDRFDAYKQPYFKGP